MLRWNVNCTMHQYVLLVKCLRYGYFIYKSVVCITYNVQIGYDTMCTWLDCFGALCTRQELVGYIKYKVRISLGTVCNKVWIDSGSLCTRHNHWQINDLTLGVRGLTFSTRKGALSNQCSCSPLYPAFRGKIRKKPFTNHRNHTFIQRFFWQNTGRCRSVQILLSIVNTIVCMQFTLRFYIQYKFSFKEVLCWT